MPEKNEIGRRFKEYYENRNKYCLTRRIPVILRLDGKAFHTYTKNFNKPFDEDLSTAMKDSAEILAKHIQGVKCAYIYLQVFLNSVVITGDITQINRKLTLAFNF